MPDRAMCEQQDMQQRVLAHNPKRAISGGALLAEDEIGAACQRVMPDTVQRCVATVVIQRGGARR